LVLGETENSGFWVLDNRTARYGNAELEAMIIALAEKWHPSTVVIEENAHGQSLITRLEDTTNISVTPIFKSRDKVWYANQHAVPLWESRKVRVPSFEPWTTGFLEELYSFPKGLHDDQVDCFSMGLNELVEGSPGQGFLKWLESSSKKKAFSEAD
jgi:predicted phage terminase large subunit-like protein